MSRGTARTSDSDSRADYVRYGRRRGRKLRSGRRRLLQEALPRIRVPLVASGEVDGVGLSELRSPFSDLWLEIGFGQGEHLAAQARSYPEVLFVGCEPYIDGVSSLLRVIDAEAIENLLIHDDDARAVLDALPEASVGRMFLLFPDPWPKRRHHKRRFISPGNLDRISRVLADGAQLRFATDHPEYARWALWHAVNHTALEWPADSPKDWTRRPADWPCTRYEQKALQDRGTCLYLTFIRRPRAGSSVTIGGSVMDQGGLKRP